MFNVGDEVVCVNDLPQKVMRDGVLLMLAPSGLKKGQTYTVLAVYPKGTSVRKPDGHEINFCSDFVGVGVPDRDGHDSWWSERFRKVVRKRTRSEFYALIGISDLVTKREAEVVS